MFEFTQVAAPEPRTCAPAGLSASSIGQWQQHLSCSMEETNGLDDAGRMDSLRALEQLICTATAAQAALAAELDSSRRAADADAGVPAARRGTGVASMVAHARRESPQRGQTHLGLAIVVRVELPHTWVAWRAGRITEWAATIIARETACLSLEHRLCVDATIAADGEALEAMSIGEMTGQLRREAERLDPAAVVKRRRKAESERHVSLRPAPDTMTWLTALLPVKDGVACIASLTAHAQTVSAAGDERSTGQVMADRLVAAVTGRVGFETSLRPSSTTDVARPSSTTDVARPSSTTDVARPSSAGVQLPIELGLMMTDQALFGGADDGAHLSGYGPIPAELAREIVAGALAADEGVGIRRLYTDPASGELVAMESTTRTFRGALARFIRLRDQICRTPWCDAPIRHLDHTIPDSRGGPTTATNGQGLCEACNYAKEGTGWRARPGPDGSIDTTMPGGHTYRTRPPAVATIRQTHLPPLQIDYLLTG